jgi:D-3-phosphoglycerate dehydrogenase
LRAGRWNKQEYSNARGLFGRTIGLIGYGSIGAEVARRAEAFGMQVVVWSRRLTTGTVSVVPFTVAASPEELAAASDVVSVHLALTPQTRGFIGASVLGRMRPGSSFINTARAEVVDQRALASAAREGTIRIGLDVFAGEPGSAAADFADPLVGLPNVYGTHHIGGSTDQAQEAIAAEAVRVVSAYKTTGRVPNVVNLAEKTPATHRLIVRHRDRPGVLAHVFDVLKTGRVNVQETENVIFEGAEAAVARISVDALPPDALIAEIRDGNPDILDLRVVTI